MGKLISYQEAQRRVLGAVELLPVVELPLEEAVGLALVREVKADRDLPPFGPTRRALRWC